MMMIMSGRIFLFLVAALCLLAPRATRGNPAAAAEPDGPQFGAGREIPAREQCAEGLFSCRQQFRDAEDAGLLRRREHRHGAQRAHAPAPSTPEYQPYRTFTQDNLLTEETDAMLPRDVLARQGMTLDQLGELLSRIIRWRSRCATPPTAGSTISAPPRATISPAGPLRHRELSAHDDRPGDRRPYLAARRL